MIVEKTKNHEDSPFLNSKIVARILEETTDGVQIVDLGGRIIYSNKAIEKIYGFTPQEYLGKHVGAMNADPGFANKVIIPAVQKTGRWSGELIVKHKSGRKFPVWLTASLIKDEKGNSVVMSGIVRDISEHQKMDKEMSRYIKDLEFLASSANQFLKHMPIEALHLFIAKRLKSLSPKGSLVAVAQCDSANDSMTVCNVLGFQKEENVKLSQILGQSHIGITFKTTEETRRWMKQGVLSKIQGMHDLSFKQLPQNVSKEIEEEFGLGEIYSMPIIAGKDLLGAVAIITRKGEILINRYLIEIFVNQASVALRHKKTEEELRESEQRFRAIFNDADIGITLSDLNRRPIEVNAAYQKMMGFAKEELQKMVFNDFTHPDDIYFGKNQHKKLRQGKVNHYSLEKRYIRKDGKVLWAHLRVSLVKDALGDPKYTIGVISDITKRKQMEEKLYKSEERYALAQQAANIGSWDWDIKTGHLDWSEQIEPIFGFKRGEFRKTYDAFLECVHPKDRKFVIGSVNISIEKGKDYDIEHRIVWPDKTIRWVSETGKVIRDKDDRAIRMIGLVADITKRKEAEEELKESQAKFKSVTQSANDAIITADKRGNIISWNKGAQNIFGYKEKEVFGKPLTILMPLNYREAHQTGINRLETIGKSHIIGKTIEMQGLRKGEVQFPIELSLSTWSLKKDRYYTGIIRDITRRKELENRRDEFISIASHELKTPLTSIKVLTQILQKKLSESKDDNVQIHLLSRMDKQVNKLTDLIRELLDVTKIQTGKLELKEELFSIANLIEEIADDIATSTDNKYKIIIKRGTKEKIVADKYRTAQVISNLLMNAVDYSPNKNKIIVRVTSEKDRIKVSVQDFGIGIPKDKQSHIFERFYQAHTGEGLTGRFSSLGLGLYISSEIIRHQGGRIWVKSVEQKGSTFYFTLPKRTGGK